MVLAQALMEILCTDALAYLWLKKNLQRPTRQNHKTMNGNLIAGKTKNLIMKTTFTHNLEDCADICLIGPGPSSKAYSENKLPAVFH